MHPFEVRNSVVLSRFISLCNHFHCPGRECFHHPQKQRCMLTVTLTDPLHPPHGPPPTPPTLWRPLSYVLSLWFCLVWTFRINESTQHVAFRVWLLSRSWCFKVRLVAGGGGVCVHLHGRSPLPLCDRPRFVCPRAAQAGECPRARRRLTEPACRPLCCQIGFLSGFACFPSLFCPF